MKILELRFKNLNSLYGEWCIDFTDPAYIANGIFSLTGPTGAGKSTVLDAICLALYSATPRLGNITKSGNEIMSRQTGECYAEVVFASQKGRFRCHWEQRRSRKKIDGALQAPMHQIAEDDTGKLLENKKSLVSGVIEKKTGMDFDRFTRSILLAQGGFDTFLKADVEQKSKILEQITGTEIYTEISKRVHERQKEERNKLNLLHAETAGIIILEPEQEKDIKEDLETKQKEESELAAKSFETERAITWLTALDGLKKEIKALSEDEKKLQTEIDAFKPERERLEWGLTAVAFDGAYAKLTEIRKQQSKDQADLKRKEDTLPELEASVKEKAEALTSAEQLTSKAKKDLKTEAPLIKEVRAIDQKLDNQIKDISKAEESCQKDVQKIESEKKSRLTVQEKSTEAHKNLKLAQNYLNKHSQDEWLVSGFAGVEEQLGRLDSKQTERMQKEVQQQKAKAALGQAVQKLKDRVKQSNARKKELADAVKKRQQGKEALSELLGGRLLREYRTEKETLLRELAFRKKIEELEDLRAKLEDGKPCPLCGAQEHPFAQGNIPIPDETEIKIGVLTELIGKAEDQEAVIKTLEKAENAAHKKLTDSEKVETAAKNKKLNLEKDLSDLTNGFDKIQSEFARLKQAVSAKLEPLGITEIPDADVSSLLESLRERLEAWQVQVNEKAEVEKQIAELESDLKRLDAVIETQSAALVEKQQHLESLKKECAARKKDRQKLYGDKDPDDEELDLNNAINDAEQAEKNINNLYHQLQRSLTSTKNEVGSLKKRIAQRETDLNTSEGDFSTGIENAGFADEKQFTEARLTAKERDDLIARAKKLDDGQTDLKARLKDRETRLTTELAKKITDQTLEELELLFSELQGTLKQLRDTIAGLKHKLADNSAAKERIKAKQKEIEAQKQECLRWKKLHGLIGSADGKKYRNFAQGLTFELMVSHANRQLEKMTDRYLLIRDDEQPLELNVVDNYQAGEIRSTKNLSGGESFIVSLALALGLSKMASRKVRVDSLFLDEGFGTLDEESLETALETLSGLQQDGKLIGIISHVSALKERISTQINVTPVSGGRSTLSGPGCSKVVDSKLKG